jgi:hypothetical protein
VKVGTGAGGGELIGDRLVAAFDAVHGSQDGGRDEAHVFFVAGVAVDHHERLVDDDLPLAGGHLVDGLRLEFDALFLQLLLEELVLLLGPLGETEPWEIGRDDLPEDVEGFIADRRIGGWARGEG